MRTGRPPLDNPRTQVIRCRVTPDDARTIADAAARAGQNPADWMRDKLTAAAKRQRGKG